MGRKGITTPGEPDKRIRAIIDAVLQPVAVVDPADEIVLFWSDTARKLFGHCPELVSDWYKAAYPDPVYREEVIRRWKQELEIAEQKKDPHNTGEFNVTCADGSIRICELVASFIDEYLIVSFQDITGKKQEEVHRREREELLAQTEEIAHVGSWKWDISSDTVTWSDELFRIFGIDPEGGAPSYADHHRIYTPESMELLDKHVMKTIKDGTPYELDLEIVRNDGELRHCTARGYARADRSGKVVQLFGSFQEITARKNTELELKQLNEALAAQNDEYLSLNDEMAEVNEALQKEKERAEEYGAFLRAAMENSQAGIAIADLPDGKLRFINEAGLKISKYGDEMSGEAIDINQFLENWPIYRLDGTPYKRDEAPFARAILKGERSSEELIVKRENGDESFLFVNTAPVYNESGVQIAGIVVFLDITELKLTQVKLQETVDKLKVLNRKYRESMLKAEESDALKSVFLANMSHEIRTPMNGIIGFTNLLLKPNLSDDKRANYIEIIQKSSMRMLNTVNDLIDISRIETGQLDLQIERVDLCQLVESIVAFYRQEAEQKGLDFLLETDNIREACFVETDIGKFESILSNLLKNAIKFTEEGHIRIVCNQKDGFFLFSVEDTGIGIEPKNQEKVFSRFVRESRSDGKVYEGSGLGLSITHGYVELLGGRIWLESELGKGSTFNFILPQVFSEKTQEKVRLSGKGKTNESAKKLSALLIAEDDETSYLHLHELLRDRSRQILRAETGEEAVELVRENSDIELVLMDIKMPVMDGLEATRRIREFNKDIQIVGQSAYALQGDRQKALEAGCDDFITKPIIESTLLAALQRLERQDTDSDS